MKKLNIGCGKDIKKNYINLDFIQAQGIDVVHNLNKLPYPFQDNCFDKIIALQVIEHLNDYNHTIKEMNRILRRGGEIVIEVPHFTSMTAFHPEHKLFFNVRSFLERYDCQRVDDLISLESSCNLDYTSKVTIILFKGLQIWNYILEPLININTKTQIFYESSFISRLFPAWKIRFTGIKK